MIENLENYLRNGVLDSETAQEQTTALLQLLCASYIRKIPNQTTHVTPGTRTTHLHGISHTPTRIIPVCKAANDDVDNAPSNHIAVVSVSPTAVVVKSHFSAVQFDLYVG